MPHAPPAAAAPERGMRAALSHLSGGLARAAAAASAASAAAATRPTSASAASLVGVGQRQGEAGARRRRAPAVREGAAFSSATAPAVGTLSRDGEERELRRLWLESIIGRPLRASEHKLLSSSTPALQENEADISDMLCEETVARLLDRNPKVLQMKPGTLRSKLRFLEDSFPSLDAGALVFRTPRLLNIATGKIARNAAELCQLLQLRDIDNLVWRAPHLLARTPTTLEDNLMKLAYLLQLNQPDAIKLVQKNPALLLYSSDGLAEKVCAAQGAALSVEPVSARARH